MYTNPFLYKIRVILVPYLILLRAQQDNKPKIIILQQSIIVPACRQKVLKHQLFLSCCSPERLADFF